MRRPEELSNAQCLRVIGQYLDAHRTDSFHLRTFGSSFIISSDDLAKRPRSKTPTGFLSRITRRALSGEDSPPSDYLIFSRREIHQVELEGQTRRKAATSTIEPNDFSVSLRALGDYFDRKNVAEFAIDWSPNSITARYGTHEENFTRPELYNFGVRMYLRRADRAH